MVKDLQQKLGSLLLPPTAKKQEKTIYEIAYMVNKESDMAFCYADSKARAIKIATRMSEGNYYFVEIAKYRGDDFIETIDF